MEALVDDALTLLKKLLQIMFRYDIIYTAENEGSNDMAAQSDEVITNGVNKSARKKHYIIFICIAAVCLSLIILSTVCLGKLNFFNLSPRIAKMFIGEDPEVFCANNGETSSLYQMFVYANVTKSGNLILIMTDEQVESWKNSNFYLQLLQKIVGNKRQVVSETVPPADPILKIFYEDADKCGYIISEDYTVVCADENSLSLYFPMLTYPCIAMQVLSGKPSDEISYTYIEYDGAGNIVSEYIWPDDFK